MADLAEVVGSSRRRSDRDGRPVGHLIPDRSVNVGSVVHVPRCQSGDSDTHAAGSIGSPLPLRLVVTAIVRHVWPPDLQTLGRSGGGHGRAAHLLDQPAGDAAAIVTLWRGDMLGPRKAAPPRMPQGDPA